MELTREFAEAMIREKYLGMASFLTREQQQLLIPQVETKVQEELKKLFPKLR
jgi:hypothetical protein